VLTTARLWIRPFTFDDVPDATAAVGLLMDGDERNREWIARLGVDHQRERGYAYWQCRDKGTGQLLGRPNTGGRLLRVVDWLLSKHPLIGCIGRP